jgi:hypothetical protein
MRTFSLFFVASLASFLGACASTDHSAALALGTAGVTASQALSDQTASTQLFVTQLGPTWGVRNALVCTAVKPDLRAGCLNGATSTPDPTVSAKLAQISDVLTKRKQALATLNQAYAAYVDLAKYNAGQEATSALATSFTKVNSFLSAASILSPGGAAIPAISATVQTVTGGAAALASDSQQNRQLLAASKDLHTANDAMVKGLTLERDATVNLLVTLQAERAALGASALKAGLLSPTDVLTPVLTQAFPDAHIATPPAINSDAIMAAASNVLAAQNQTAIALAPKSYDDALGALSALSAQHQKFETNQSLNLSEIEAEIASLQADVAQMTPSPSTPKAAAK